MNNDQNSIRVTWIGGGRTWHKDSEYDSVMKKAKRKNGALCVDTLMLGADPSQACSWVTTWRKGER